MTANQRVGEMPMMRLRASLMAGTVLLAGLGLSVPAHAEGRCPPGFYPTGSEAAGWLGCAPMGPMEEGPEESSGGGYSDGLPPMHYDPEQLRIWAEAATRREAALERERMRDPVYRRLSAGYWEYVDADPADSKEICMATFLTRRGGVILMDWGGEYPGTYLAFFGGSISRTADIQRLRVSLTQSGEEQIVQAFHAPLPWEPSLGMVMFAVPSTSALLDNIEAVQDFEVKLQDQTLVWGEWHSGTEARDHLRSCIQRRQA